MATKYYTILAGRKEPAKVLQGNLSRTTGMPIGETQKISIVVGKILIPNFSRVWGQRLGDGTKSASAAVTDPKYRGDIKFLPWGAEGGESIEIRWMKRSNSLDKLYQETVQKITMDANGEEGFMSLDQGINNFDESADKMLILMLKNHSLNYNAVSKRPDMNDFDYVEFNSKNRNDDRIIALNFENQANTYLLEAANDTSRLAILALIFNEDDRQDDGLLFEKLTEKAKSYPKDFVGAINNYVLSTEKLLIDVKEAGIMTIDAKGSVKLLDDGGGSKVLCKTEGEDSDQLLFMVKNVLKNRAIYDATVELRSALKKYQLALN